MKQTLQQATNPRAEGRPYGCAKLATALDPEALRLAIAICNRATRRVAKKNLAKLQKSGGV